MLAGEVSHQVFDVVAHLMRDDVCIGEIAVRAELLLHRREEGKVDIEFLVGRAVEGAHGRLPLAAAGRSRARVEHEGRGLIGLSHLLEHLRPDILRRGEDLLGEGGELLLLFGEGGLADRFGLAAENRSQDFRQGFFDDAATDSAAASAHKLHDKGDDKADEAGSTGNAGHFTGR